MVESRIDFLAKKWEGGKITAEEMHEFEHWYNSFDDSEKKIDSYVSEEQLKQKIYAKIEAKIHAETSLKKAIVNSRYKKWITAASIILILSFGGYLFHQNHRSASYSLTAFDNTGNQYDVLPGGNKAILLLGDGRQMILENGDSILLSNIDGSQILSDGQKLTFNVQSRKNKRLGETAYNTIVTPSSGQFQVILPDGSHVWLNAESSLRFPSQFADKRQVMLTGEGYFEVAQDPSKPFEVLVDGQKIQVLGTHFNVNAYADEKEIKTTLIEGKVRLMAGKNSVFMKPGQESIVSKDPQMSNEIILRKSDGQQTIAWKNGLFDFKDADIGTIMRAIARWYNVEITYQHEDSRKFSGRIYRTVNLQEALTILNYSGINTILEESTLPDKNGKITVL